MATQLRFIFAPVLLLVMLFGCGSPLPSTPTSIPTSAPNKVMQASILVDLDGSAYIRREGWVDYQSIGFGELVYPTDLLKTDGKISLLCSDLQSVMHFTDYGRNPCPLPVNEKPLSYDQMLFASGSRGVPRLDVPYILYPRNTAIIEKQPVFQWHDTGGSTYTVELWEGATLIWNQSDVVGNSIEYPINAPKLEPGKDYLLIVTDNNSGMTSSADPNKGLGFQLITKTQTVEIEKQKKAISSLSDIDPIAKKFVLAMYYVQLNMNGRGLWGEASRLFGEVTNAHFDAPAARLPAGAVLAKMKLWREAQTEYEIALTHAQKLNDLECQADAIGALWRITGNPSQFDQAISLYEKLGAQDKADKMKKEKTP